jgi:hypothetical protein
MEKDIIVIEFNEQACSSDAIQFTFAENLLKYLEGAE